MPTAEDFQALADRTKRELDAVYDFYDHSLFAWDSLWKAVAGGKQFTIKSQVTGTSVDQHGLVELMPRYIRKYLIHFTFRQFVAIFESFFFDFLRLLFTHNPYQFGKKQLAFSVVLTAKDRDEIIASFLGKELNELKYEPVRAWFDTLHKAAALGCPSDDEVDTLAEIKAARDLLEHNAGVVNDTYLRKAGKNARFPLGEEIELDDDYHLVSLRLVRKVTLDLSGTAVGKMGNP